jgi:cation transport regulator ChaC
MFYFAYGSNMDPVQMAERCPGAVALGAAHLPDWRLTFTRDSPGWGGGVGHIERAAGDEVWGVLWDVTSAHLSALDEYEGVAVGMYARSVVVVAHAGSDVEAVVYLADPRGYKPPSKKYIAALVRGVEAHGVPNHYIERLRALG